MVTTLWIIMFYLMIGFIVYLIALNMMNEENPTAQFSELNNVMLLMIVFLWFPMLIHSIFSK
jgi:hypothetical protein